jgi:zinc protease
MRSRVGGPVARTGLPALLALMLSATAPPPLATRAHLFPPLADSTTTLFDVAGIRVILRQVWANDIVAGNLYLLGGTQELTERTAGIEVLMLEASGYGTTHYSRDALRNQLAALGSTVQVESSQDWTKVGFRGITSAFDSTWTLFADRISHPTLDSASVELVRAQMLAAAAQRRADPDALAEYLADSVAFANHPYALTPLGTERALRAMTRSDVQRYHAERVVRSRMLVVVVGNIDRSRLERLIQSTLGALPMGSYSWHTPPAVPDRRGDVVLVQRALPTNYIVGYYQGPSASDPDAPALRIAAAVLSGNLFSEIRSRRNLSYAVDAPFLDRALSGGGLYVTTTFPDSVLMLMRRGVDALQRMTVEREGLDVLVQQFITQYFLENETNAAQADFLARSQLYQGDYRLADRFVAELRAVTPEDVRRTAQRYMRAIRFAYVGDTTRVSRASFARFD